MSQQVSIYFRTRLPDGSRPYLNPVFTGNHKLEPSHAMVDGQPKKLNNGSYYLRFKEAGIRRWESAGANPRMVIAKQMQWEQMLAAQAKGIIAPLPRLAPQAGKASRQPAKQGEAVRLTTVRATQVYLGDISKYRRGKTYVAYRNSIDQFLATCTKEFLDEIERRDILDFVDALKRNGNGKRTITNKVKPC
jgi:integrase/recombinase XerD